MAANETFKVLLGSNVGAVACAKISPVLGFITMTVPLIAPEALTA